MTVDHYYNEKNLAPTVRLQIAGLRRVVMCPIGMFVPQCEQFLQQEGIKTKTDACLVAFTKYCEEGRLDLLDHMQRITLGQPPNLSVGDFWLHDSWFISQGSNKGQKQILPIMRGTK